MKLVTSETMRAIDTECIERVGIPGLKLMENAGVGTVQFIERELGPQRGRAVTVVCGKGNNGGDGFVIARELKRLGASVSVYLAGHRDDVGGDAHTNLERLGTGQVVELADGRSIGEFVEATTKSDLIVDAVFGTGFSGVPRGLSGTVIGQMNASGRPVLAVDVPSGLNATTGVAEGECVDATWTCTMGLSKRGFYLGQGRDCVGTVHVVDIGVPASVIETVGVRDNVLSVREAAALLPGRAPDGHKGTFGRVAVLAGSVGYTGAAALTAMAALRSGAGLVELGVPSSLNDIMEVKLTEVITKPLAETDGRSLSPEALPGIRELLENADSLALGPGISRHRETGALVESVVAEMRVPCVIDADALNALTPEKIGQRTGGAAVVMTPHPGEMARLARRTVGEVMADRDGVARDVAARSRATVLLKGAGTVDRRPVGRTHPQPDGQQRACDGRDRGRADRHHSDVPRTRDPGDRRGRARRLRSRTGRRSRRGGGRRGRHDSGRRARSCPVRVDGDRGGGVRTDGIAVREVPDTTGGGGRQTGGTMTKGFAEKAESLAPKLSKIRRQIHMYPELGYQEKRTAELVAKTLRQMGLEVKTGVAKTGVVGLLRGGAPGKTVALRADMDALPITERNKKPYRSRVEGVMHACGHDGNTTTVLGAAMLLAKERRNLRGNVKFFFQPSEEAPPGGALPMIKEGVLEKPKVDFVIGVHVDPTVPAGKIGLRDGPMMAAADDFTLSVLGDGLPRRQAAPRRGRDRPDGAGDPGAPDHPEQDDQPDAPGRRDHRDHQGRIQTERHRRPRRHGGDPSHALRGGPEEGREDDRTL